jgi:hypothetical protein
MRMFLHFAPIIITSRLGKVQIYPVLWHWTFAAEKAGYNPKNKKKIEHHFISALNSNKMTRMRMSLHFAPIIITSRLGKGPNISGSVALDICS